MNLSHIAFYTCGLLLCATILFFTLMQQHVGKPQNRLFLTLVSLLTVNLLGELIVSFTEPAIISSPLAFTVTNILQFLYFLTHSALCPVFFLYVHSVCGKSLRSLGKWLLYAVPFLLMELVVLLDPLLHWVYHYDAQQEFVRGWGETVIYLIAGAYLVMSVLMLLFSWNALTARRRSALIYCFFLVFGGILVQLLLIDVRCELFSEALAFMGVMMAVETEGDRINTDTGLYNRKALGSDIKGYLLNRRTLQLICIKIRNPEIILRMTGSENADILSGLIGEYLRTLVPLHRIYCTAPETFLVLLPDADEARARDMSAEILSRFEAPWRCADSELMLQAVVMAADAPGRIHSETDALFMADSPIPDKLNKQLLIGCDLDYLMRRAALRQAVTRGLENGFFQVHYQPTYHLPTMRLHGAEALVRLQDTIIGRVYPDEFIPIAEQTGMISEIDNLVLLDTCRFLRSGIPDIYGMDCINVNLSMVHCMQPGFAEVINSIVEESGIEKRKINFEITESIASSDYKRLGEIVSQLREEGYQFSMDDYGTGYSNIHSFFSLEFDIVKIDKSILWGAQESEMGRILLESTIRMLRQMGRRILVEGVETQEQIDLLRRLSVDYAQGYYFSKPLPKEQFIHYIEHVQKLF
ncbi:MAG: EAL domain-containing protein [Oscillospiraceae bacterium]|nr:EAL domain-containing protein [Oscillospiraceae bacterium]